MDSTPKPTEPSTTQLISPAPSHQRPWSVTILALGVLIITVINLIRFVLSLRYWSFLSSRSGISPIYLSLTGFIWSAACLFVLRGLWTAKNWAPRLMQAVALTYALYYWLDHIFLMQHSVSGASATMRMLLPANWRFSATVTVVSLVFLAWTLNRSRVKAYFGLSEAEIGPNQASRANQG